MKEKRLSILGDSISTYTGVSNDEDTNATLLMNPCFYRPPFPKEKTYWYLVAEELGLTLCTNNSWSGGNLSGRDDPDSGVNRADFLSTDSGEEPDVVILFMGTNDLGRGVAADVFHEDYRLALSKIRARHPKAEICCVNIPDRTPQLRARAAAMNKAIDDAAASLGSGCYVADLFGSKLRDDVYYMNTVDGLHPDEDGMRMIAEIIVEAIRKHQNN